MREDNDSNVKAMITRLIWTIWTSLYGVRCPGKAVKFNHSLTHSLNMLESLLCILNIIDIISCFDWPGGRVINICIGYVVISLMHKALKQGLSLW